MMTSSQLNMRINLCQLKTLPGCKIVLQKKTGFSAELNIRNGRYTIRIDYREYEEPDVFIVNPVINMSNPIDIHTFGVKYHPAYKKELPQLCLTYYEIDKWNSSALLIRSFIPWAIEWTEFYEIWLLTGKWFGKGVHPENGEKKEK